MDIQQEFKNYSPPILEPHLTILGIAQDAGYPQANCKKSCCKNLWNDKDARKMVSSIAFRDPNNHAAWIFDATPDFKDQLEITQKDSCLLHGIFLTHAHMGHYTGLMHLGREAMGAKQIPVYAKPRMKSYLENNGPWSQLVELKNIELRNLENDNQINENFSVESFEVPHRDEFSETVGFKIIGPNKSALFIPDIDKWNLWDTDINALVQKVDYAFLDGTFFQNGEIWGRDMSQIPHPFVEESIEQFEKLDKAQKSKIYFIHLNHTNPLLKENSKEKQYLESLGYNVAVEGMNFLM